MKKKTKIIFVIVGLIVVVLGIIFYVNKDSKQPQPSDNTNKTEEVDEFAYNGTFKDEYIKNRDFTERIIFPVIENLQLNGANDYDKSFYNDLSPLKVAAYFEKGFSSEKLVQMYLEDYKIMEDIKYDYDTKEFENMTYLKITTNFESGTSDNKKYAERHYFIMNSGEDELAIVVYSINDKKASESFINSIRDKIKITTEVND